MIDGTREAVRLDLSAIIVIERASFGDPWSHAMFARYLEDTEHHQFIVATLAGRVAGYAVAQCVADESELLNIAVDAGFRGRGIGRTLLDEIMARSAASGATEMWLDVRTSNEAARALYVARGFGEMAVRKRYYESPREDALVLRADLRGVLRGEFRQNLRAGPSVGRNDTVMETGHGLMPDPVERILSRASHLPRQEPK